LKKFRASGGSYWSKVKRIYWI